MDMVFGGKHPKAPGFIGVIWKKNVKSYLHAWQLGRENKFRGKKPFLIMILIDSIGSALT